MASVKKETQLITSDDQVAQLFCKGDVAFRLLAAKGRYTLTVSKLDHVSVEDALLGSKVEVMKQPGMFALPQVWKNFIMSLLSEVFTYSHHVESDSTLGCQPSTRHSGQGELKCFAYGYTPELSPCRLVVKISHGPRKYEGANLGVVSLEVSLRSGPILGDAIMIEKGYRPVNLDSFAVIHKSILLASKGESLKRLEAHWKKSPGYKRLLSSDGGSGEFEKIQPIGKEKKDSKDKKKIKPEQQQGSQEESPTGSHSQVDIRANPSFSGNGEPDRALEFEDWW